MKLGNVLKKTALAAALVGSALVATASSADARIVCNRWGHCWHTYRPYYDPYYDPYYYPSYYGPGYYGPSYYGPSYYGPGVTFGFSFGGGGHHWHGGGHHH